MITLTGFPCCSFLSSSFVFLVVSALSILSLVSSASCWDLPVSSPYFYADTVSPVHRARPRGRRDVFSLSLLVLSHTCAYIYTGTIFLPRCLCVSVARFTTCVVFPQFLLADCVSGVRSCYNKQRTYIGDEVNFRTSHAPIFVITGPALTHGSKDAGHCPSVPAATTPCQTRQIVLVSDADDMPDVWFI
jgi:hypothetical protein